MNPATLSFFLFCRGAVELSLLHWKSSPLRRTLDEALGNLPTEKAYVIVLHDKLVRFHGYIRIFFYIMISIVYGIIVTD